jgi:hypothetical protein
LQLVSQLCFVALSHLEYQTPSTKPERLVWVGRFLGLLARHFIIRDMLTVLDVAFEAASNKESVSLSPTISLINTVPPD